MSAPSFFLALFKRGRYRRLVQVEGGTGETVARQEIERFTAAVIAFCFEHDSQFRQHFWDRICRLDGDPAIPDSPEIQVEPHAWADLLVRSRGAQRDFVHVIECKVGASLEEHQNPATEAFAKDGYGYEFHRQEGASAELRYIILGVRDAFPLPARHTSLQIELAQRSWKDLECGPPHSSLMADFFHSLGDLGVGNYNMLKTKNLTITGGLAGIPAAFSIIGDTLRSFDLDRGMKYIEAGKISDTAGFLGCFVQAADTPGLDSTLQRLTGSARRQNLLWLGYIFDADESVKRSVWFYCVDEPHARSLRSGLLEVFPSCTIEVDDPYFCVVVEQTPTADQSDSEWFAKAVHAGASLADVH